MDSENTNITPDYGKLYYRLAIVKLISMCLLFIGGFIFIIYALFLAKVLFYILALVTIVVNFFLFKIIKKIYQDIQITRILLI